MKKLILISFIVLTLGSFAYAQMGMGGCWSNGTQVTSSAQAEDIVKGVLADGYSVTGTLFSMISVRTKTREIMLPLLMLPILIPVIIAAILSTNIFLLGHDITYSYNWIKLMAVFDVIFTAVIFGIFGAIIEE